ncbi:hypothetical protein JTE90_010587 [Oedothorax gibbosus]|uniref:Uncharacterized protein n=1 Tax=Oedothorax gibbosus TaxID=931172 RepID=A0AAV6V3R2_9ARAC|nr:hypothetical protein JTE90_010587 [Oedothorax gibbosus]
MEASGLLRPDTPKQQHGAPDFVCVGQSVQVPSGEALTCSRSLHAVGKSFVPLLCCDVNCLLPVPEDSCKTVSPPLAVRNTHPKNNNLLFRV